MLTLFRVAGGWVRDKLLNQQSVDIDIALDDQSGIEFANSVNEYLTFLGKETRTICLIQVSDIVMRFVRHYCNFVVLFRLIRTNQSISRPPTLE